MGTNPLILLSVLRAIASRPPDHPFERPVVDGMPREQVDAVVAELHRGGYVVAMPSHDGLGDPAPRDFLAPSVLTVAGRLLFDNLTGGSKP